MKHSSYFTDNLEVNIYEFNLLDSRMYLIIKGDNAIVIDPHYDEEAIAVLKEKKEVIVILTHEHFDHISGVNLFKDLFSCRVYASKECDDEIHGKRNSTATFPFLFLTDKEKYLEVRNTYEFPYVCDVDVTFDEEMHFDWHGDDVWLFVTKGHSPGSISVTINDQFLFSGDVLLGNGKELESIHADEEEYRKTLEKYQLLCQEDTMIFPGHGEYGYLKPRLDKIMR